MQMLEIDSIVILEDRQRKKFDPQAHQDLVDSIMSKGLIHAIAVRPNTKVLLAGERRVRAIKDIYMLGQLFKFDGYEVPFGFIPAITLAEMSDLEFEEAEFDENDKREALSWQEKAVTTARLSALRTKQAATLGDSLPTVASISLEVRGSAEGINHENTRREIIISKHLGNPAVAAAKSLDEAWKALKRDDETQRNVALAVQVGRTFSAALHRIEQTDAVAWLAQCPNSSFDVILTDPPYGINADAFGDSGGKVPGGSHGYRDDPTSFELLMQAMWKHFYRIAKPQAHLYVFCDIDRFVDLRDDFAVAGWSCFRTPLIWHKPNGNRAPWPERGPHRKYEIILYATKGGKNVTKLYPDLVSYPSDDNLGWNAQKPVALYEDLLKRSVRAGDSVLDCFCGTGPIFPAAHGLKCIATGIEQDPAAYGIALNRLKGLK